MQAVPVAGSPPSAHGFSGDPTYAESVGSRVPALCAASHGGSKGKRLGSSVGHLPWGVKAGSPRRAACRRGRAASRASRLALAAAAGGARSTCHARCDRNRHEHQRSLHRQPGCWVLPVRSGRRDASRLDWGAPAGSSSQSVAAHSRVDWFGQSCFAGRRACALRAGSLAQQAPPCLQG